MGSTIQHQLWETASGLLAGGGLGLLFELMRSIMSAKRRILRYAAQLTYLLIAAVWVFLAGQLGGRGATALYLLVCAAGWGLTYVQLNSLWQHLQKRKTANQSEKLSDNPDMPYFADKKQKKDRNFFSKGTMQKRKNHI